MYKFFFVPVVALSFAACKRDRTCTCVQVIDARSSNEPGYSEPLPKPDTSVTVYKNVRRNGREVQMCQSSNGNASYSYSVSQQSDTAWYELTTTGRTRCALDGEVR